MTGIGSSNITKLMFLLRTSWFPVVLAEALLILTAAPALAWAGVFPYQYRLWPAFFVVGLTALRMAKERWGWKRLGLAPERFWDGGVHYLILTAFSAVIMYTLVRAVDPNWMAFEIRPWMILSSFGISFVQELVFRTFLIESLEKRGWSRFHILIFTAFTFAFIHIFFQRYMFLFVPMCFAYSWLLSWLYLRYRNLYFATFSHFGLNLLTLHLGLHLQ